MYKTFIRDYDKKLFTVKSKDTQLFNIKIRNKIEKRKIKIVYSTMKSRCYNPNATSYERYGGRGILIEDSFSTFDKFYIWSINNNFQFGLEIDRINNNGNYSENNCRWITHKENNRNTSGNIMNWHIVDRIRNGGYKYKENTQLSKELNCSIFTIKNVKDFKICN